MIASIIVLNYQGEHILAKTIESLINLNFPKDKFEIIIVDNASKDGSKRIIDSYCSDQDVKVRSLYLDRNLGFGGGNNEGIKISKGKYVALINNDCIAEKNWLTELVKTIEKDKKIFAVGSKSYLRNTNRIQNAGILMFNDGYGRDVGAIVKNNKQEYMEDLGQFNKEKNTYAACAVAVLYRKEIFDKIGYFDNTFFMYYEDVELSERARAHGYKVLYCPKAVVHHNHATSSGEWSIFFIYHSELGRLLHVFFWFPQIIFWKEYFKFFVQSFFRILVGIRRRQIIRQGQYAKISIYLLISLPKLYWKRSQKMKNILTNSIKENFLSIKNNNR